MMRLFLLGILLLACWQVNANRFSSVKIKVEQVTGNVYMLQGAGGHFPAGARGGGVEGQVGAAGEGTEDGGRYSEEGRRGRGGGVQGGGGGGAGCK